MQNTERKYITTQEHLMLYGLGTMAKDYHQKLCEIEKTMARLLNIKGKYGDFPHISDFIWLNSMEIPELFEKLNVEIKNKREKYTPAWTKNSDELTIDEIK